MDSHSDSLETVNMASGHYRTTGIALLSFGGVALVFSSVSSLILRLELPYMDGPAMMVTSAIMVVLGAWLLDTARRLATARASMPASPAE